MGASAGESDVRSDVVTFQKTGARLDPKPRLRGRLHQVALFIAVPAGVRLVGAAPAGSVRVAMITYALSLVGLFGASTAYHRLNWSPTTLRRLRSLQGASSGRTLPVGEGPVMWALGGLFTLGGIANLVSCSKIERFWAVVSISIAICCAVIASAV